MRYKQIKPLSEQQLDEIAMSPASLRALASKIDARAGMEFEMYVPNVEGGDDDGEQEPDYEYDQDVNSIQDAYDFFYDGDYNGRREVDRLRAKMQEEYQDWAMASFSDRWDSDMDTFIYNYLKENASNDEIAKILGREDDNEDVKDNYGRKEVAEAVEKIIKEGEGMPTGGEYWYNQAFDSAFDDYLNEDRQSEWLEEKGLERMADVENRYGMNWPYWRNVGGSGGNLSMEDIADDFGQAVGKKTKAAGSYHSVRGSARPDANNQFYIVETDGSLDEPDSGDDRGLEFVSPAMPVAELFSDLEKIKEWANRTGCYTNDSTGLHMNVSVPGWTKSDAGKGGTLDYVKLVLLMGDQYVLDQFDRASSTYSKSGLEKVKSQIRNNPELGEKLLNQMKGHLNDLASRALEYTSTHKYTSANIKDGYVEFRSPGGDWLNDLSENKSKIESTMLRFVVALDAATDTEKYRQEYLKKLYKMLAPAGETSTIEYFSKYVAGELPKAALRSFVRQAQLERKVKADSTSGTKYWWRVTRPGYNSSVEVVATNREEAIEKGKAEYTDWAALTNIQARPVRPYQEEPAPDGLKWYDVKDASGYTMMFQARNTNAAMQAAREQYPNKFPNVVSVVINDRANSASPIRATAGAPQPAGSVGRAATSSTGQWKIIDGLGRELSVFRPYSNTRSSANELAAIWARENDFDGNYQVEPADEPASTPAPGSTTDLQQQRAQGGFTGAWKVMVNGQEVHRFSGIGNVQSDANRVAADWLSQNGYGTRYNGTNSSDFEVLPVMG